MNHNERRQAAKGSKNAGTEPSAATAAALHAAGLEHFAAGRHLDAQMCCEKVLALDPLHADTLHLTGQICLQAGQYDHATEWIARAIRQEPKAEYFKNLGAALAGLGRHEDALMVFGQVVQLNPQDADSWRIIGIVQAGLGRKEEAILSYQHALKVNPDDWDAAYRTGLLLRELGRTEEALASFNLHERMPDQNALKPLMRGLALFILDRVEEGLADVKSAHALNPASAEICNLVGLFLARLGRDEEALPWYDRSLDLQPSAAGPLSNKAFALNHLHRFAECLVLYDRIRTLDPNNMRGVFQASLVHLLTGNFEAGWAGREARWAVTGLPIDRFGLSQPAWLGESINGKTILVFEDEGAGDTIQFARYVPMLTARGARVILSVTDPVIPLLAGMPGVAQCVSRSVKPLPAYDVHCPITSLPLAFETRLDTIPSGLGYLPQPPEARQQMWEARLSERLGNDSKPRVGLVWSGNPNHVNDRNRSIPLRMLSGLLGADAAFVSLQKNPKPEDAVILEQAGVIDLTAHLTDFAETAALVSRLDLVITVDTSVAHLAGALGRPTWILLPYLPDWRWLLGRDDSPWYPTARLFRQDKTRDYGSVVARVRSELDVLISERKSIPLPANDTQILKAPKNRRDRRAVPGKPRRSPNDPGTENFDALYEAGLRHMQAGRYLDARVCCERVLKIDGSHPDTLNLMGLLSHRAGQYDLAVEWTTRAIRSNPEPQYLANLGTMLLRQERHEEALKVFDKAIQLKPEDAELWNNLGSTFLRLERPDDALLTFQHMLKLNPHHHDAAFKSGHLLYNRQRFEEALKYFDLCDELQPNHALTLQMRAVSLLGSKRLEEALAVNRRAYALAPENAETRNNMGEILRQLPNRREEALQWFDRALEIRPDLIPALESKAALLIQLHRIEAAIEVKQRLCEIRPDDALTRFFIAELHLMIGDFQAGWIGREVRWNVPGLPIAYPKFSQPLWLGQEAIEGKTILVYADEGLGDTIQFVRYVPLLAERGARVVLVVHDAMLPLLSGLSGVSECLPAGRLPAFDMYCPVCSLPAAFGTQLDTIPSGARYLPPPDAKRIQAWEERLGPQNLGPQNLGPHDKLRVGFVWSGNPNHPDDQNRSLPLQMFSCLLDIDATFVSLQKDPRPADKAVLERTDIVDLTAYLTDFAETAALVSQLDLVITVDTSVAHLAGALGRPTWILLPYLSDWRWLLGRDDSPWYPTVRLFRQDATRDYGSVVARVRSELDVMISGRKSF
jgi:tetratricopeptide (TPR) repeat protein